MWSSLSQKFTTKRGGPLLCSRGRKTPAGLGTGQGWGTVNLHATPITTIREAFESELPKSLTEKKDNLLFLSST